MTLEQKAKYHEVLAKKIRAASGAAEYLKMKATTCKDETLKKVYAGLAVIAEIESEKMSDHSISMLNSYYDEKYGGIDAYLAQHGYSI